MSIFHNFFFVVASNRCELSQRFLEKFEKLADSFNAGDDLNLGRVNCEDDEEFCTVKDAKGKIEIGIIIRMSLAFAECLLSLHT